MKPKYILFYLIVNKCISIFCQECQLDLTTVAYAFVYFEKLILKVNLLIFNNSFHYFNKYQ